MLISNKALCAVSEAFARPLMCREGFNALFGLPPEHGDENCELGTCISLTRPCQVNAPLMHHSGIHVYWVVRRGSAAQSYHTGKQSWMGMPHGVCALKENSKARGYVPPCCLGCGIDNRSMGRRISEACVGAFNLNICLGPFATAWVIYAPARK